MDDEDPHRAMLIMYMNSEKFLRIGTTVYQDIADLCALIGLEDKSRTQGFPRGFETTVITQAADQMIEQLPAVQILARIALVQDEFFNMYHRR